MGESEWDQMEAESRLARERMEGPKQKGVMGGTAKERAQVLFGPGRWGYGSPSAEAWAERAIKRYLAEEEEAGRP